MRTVSRQDGRWQSRLLSGSMKFFYLLLSAKVIGVFSFFLYRACDLTRHKRWRTIVIKELKIITTRKERKKDYFLRGKSIGARLPSEISGSMHLSAAGRPICTWHRGETARRNPSARVSRPKIPGLSAFRHLEGRQVPVRPIPFNQCSSCKYSLKILF